MLKMSQECFSKDDSPTVKARSRTFDLMSQQCWSARQRSLARNHATGGEPGLKVCHPALGNHCQKTRQKVLCWALKRGLGVIQSEWVQNILEGTLTRMHAGNWCLFRVQNILEGS